jgi:anti-sigma factor RsiW
MHKVIPGEEVHLSDQELLLAADGELPTRRAEQAHSHLAACWSCRARMAEIEGTIADFARAQRESLDPQLPPMAGPAALLRAQLSEMASQRETGSWRSLFHFSAFRFSAQTLAAACIGAAFVVAAVAGTVFFRQSGLHRANPVVVALERGAEPDRSLTPGATRIVSLSDVCSMAHEEVVASVSTSLRQQVFQEYGIVNDRAEDFEVDYLIAPGLGGVEEIHNLWPEPYNSQTWNARVKDALEERLHEMVCAGKLDLSIAQRDIATDWIAAYKKYFHTDRPLSLRSDLIPSAGVRRPGS